MISRLVAFTKYLLMATLLVSGFLFVHNEKSYAQTIFPVENTDGFIRNPAMGWVLYLEEFNSIFPDAATYWDQQGSNWEKASTLYIRVPWSRMEPTEGHYAWNENENYKRLVEMARDRGLKLSFCIFIDSQDVHMQATPQFVFDGGAQGYAAESNPNLKTPYATDAIFRAKFSNFVQAFAQQYDNAAMVDYIDAQGLGWWGEMHHLEYMNASQKKDTFEWLTNLYSSNFKHVLLGGLYGPNSFSYELQEWAMKEKGYMIRRNSYGSPHWFPQSDKDKIKAHFPKVPVFAENCYQGLGVWAESCDGQTSPLRDMLIRVLNDAKETHANTLDLRGPQDASVWVNQFPDLVQDFVVNGGYRFVLTEFAFPENIVSGGEYTVSHTWKNTGVGKLPNDIRNWNYKYKPAFALLDQASGQPVYTIVDSAEPSDWIKGQNYSYTDTINFVGAPSGNYDVAVAIVNRDNNNQPEIGLAIQNAKTSSGWYKLGTTVVSGSSTVAEVQTSAKAFTAQTAGNGNIDLIADGNDTTIWASSAGTVLPQYLELHWAGGTITTDRISLSTTYGQGQGITNVDVEYFDGKRWKAVVKNQNIVWTGNSSSVETQDIPLNTNLVTKNLRVKINSANLAWGNIALSELKIWGKASSNAAPTENIAINAIASATADTNVSVGSTKNLIDDSDASSWSTTMGVTLPQYITLDFGNQTFRTDKITLAVHYGQGQGITNLDVDYWNNGKWNTAVSNVAVVWEGNTSNVEQRDILVPDIAGSRLRIKVNQANLQWGNFALNEIRVWGFGSMTGEAYDAAPKPVSVNIADSAIASATNENASYPAKNVNDGVDTIAVSIFDVTSFPQYITLNWDSVQSFNSTVLKCWYCQGQAPTEWEVQVSDDGNTDWTTVAASGTAAWSFSSTDVESREVTFPRVTNKKGLRIKVNNANLQWGNYAVNELEVYDRAESDTVSPITQAIAPTGWLNHDVTITLTATDNPGGSGVAATYYAVDGGAEQTSNNLTISTEGVHTLVYWSVDYAGNVESKQTVTVKIDKTAPEAVLQIDPTGEDLLVFGKDALSGLDSGALAPVSVIPVPSGDHEGDQKDEGQGNGEEELRTYFVTDVADNTLKLELLAHKDGHELKVRFVSLQYNGGTVLDAQSNLIKAEWNIEPGESPKVLQQHFMVGQDDAGQEVEARYSFLNNQTTIQSSLAGQDGQDEEQQVVLSGLVLLRMTTNQGNLRIDY